MGIEKFLTQKPKGQIRIEKIGFVGDVEVLDMGGGNVQQKPPTLSQQQPGRSQHQPTTKESWDAHGT